MNEMFRRFFAGRYDDNKEEKKEEDKSRKADVFAGKDSLADKLRKRRMAIESGDASGGQDGGY